MYYQPSNLIDQNERIRAIDHVQYFPCLFTKVKLKLKIKKKYVNQSIFLKQFLKVVSTTGRVRSACWNNWLTSNISSSQVSFESCKLFTVCLYKSFLSAIGNTPARLATSHLYVKFLTGTQNNNSFLHRN